nr:immunoglobulin light chain junction region [Macaca mulatta]
DYYCQVWDAGSSCGLF